jgi:hypothetical protein
VLLAVTTSNDISDNSRELKKTNEVPYFVYRDDRLILDDSFKTCRPFLRRQTRAASLGRWLRDHSRLVQLVNEGHRGLSTLLSSLRTKLHRPVVVSGGEAAPGEGSGPDLGIDMEGIPVITLAPDLQAYAEQNNVLLHGFDRYLGSGHWNAAGHRIAGELLARKLWLKAFAK